MCDISECLTALSEVCSIDLSESKKEQSMLTWKLVIGIALGAVLVKESDAVSKFYESVRERAMDQLRTWLSGTEHLGVGE